MTDNSFIEIFWTFLFQDFLPQSNRTLSVGSSDSRFRDGRRESGKAETQNNFSRLSSNQSSMREKKFSLDSKMSEKDPEAEEAPTFHRRWSLRLPRQSEAAAPSFHSPSVASVARTGGGFLLQLPDYFKLREPSEAARPAPAPAPAHSKSSANKTAATSATLHNSHATKVR